MTEHHLVREKHTIYNTLSSFQRASVATVGGLGCKDSAHADELTRLFTAAPDLLAALEPFAALGQTLKVRPATFKPHAVIYEFHLPKRQMQITVQDCIDAAEAVRKARGG